MVTPSGRNSGNITEAMNSTLTSGTPRTNSMKPTHTARIAGSCERRPSASRMASGNEQTMPTTDRIRVSGRPPHWVLSTKVRPKTPPHISTAHSGRTMAHSPSSHGRQKPG